MDETLVVELPTPSRIDQFLTNAYPTHSRTYFQYLIEQGFVHVNRKTVKKRYQTQIGDQIDIQFIPPEISEVLPENIPLDILFEDEHFVAINKPAGMVVHPAPGSPSGTFANALVHHCQTLNSDEFAPLRPGIVHRLDKDTTGVLIGAKTLEAHAKLSLLFKERQIKKIYRAIAVGAITEGLCSAPIGRHKIKRQQMCVTPDGKPAQTVFTVLGHDNGLLDLSIDLLTGRTHQIRVHLQHMKAPILGDKLYGHKGLNEKYQIDRPLLHAFKIEFIHPFTRKSISITAPNPTDLENFIEVIHKKH